MAMGGNAGRGVPRFTIRTVISTSLAVVQANLLRFLGVIFAIGIPAAVLIALAILVTARGAPTATDHGLNIDLEGGEGARMLLLVFIAAVGLAVYVLVQTAIMHGTLQTLHGRKATIGAGIARSFAVLPRVFLASLCLGLAGTAALVVFQFVIPHGGGAAMGSLFGLVFMAVIAALMVLAWVYIPVIMVERAGPLACFRRSFALTQGRRWEIFGILALVMLANWLINLLGQLLPQIGAPAAGAALSIAAALFFMALSAVLAAVSYHVLRAEKEGVAGDGVVRVFD